MSAVAIQQSHSNMPIMKKKMPKLCQDPIPTEQVLNTLRKDIASLCPSMRGSVDGEIGTVLSRIAELTEGK